MENSPNAVSNESIHAEAIFFSMITANQETEYRKLIFEKNSLYSSSVHAIGIHSSLKCSYISQIVQLNSIGT